jgi:hypothetical protein
VRLRGASPRWAQHFVFIEHSRDRQPLPAGLSSRPAVRRPSDSLRAHSVTTPRTPFRIAHRHLPTIGTANDDPPASHDSSRDHDLSARRALVLHRSASAPGKPPGNDESLAMPSFVAPAHSASVSPDQCTCETTPGLSNVLRRSRPSASRPVSIRSHLTPACSGLASLAADARR